MIDLILIGIIVGIILVFGVVIYISVRKIAIDFKDGVKEIGDNLEEIGEKVEVIGKFFTGLAIGLLKASKEQRSLVGKNLVEGLKMVEESKTTEELLEKLSREQLPGGGKGEESKVEKSEDIQ